MQTLLPFPHPTDQRRGSRGWIFARSAIYLLVLWGLLGCESTTEPKEADDVGSMDAAPALLEMNRRLFETKILEQDPAFLKSVSDRSYHVIAPGGVVETREQLIADLWAFSTVDSIRVQNELFLDGGRTAVIINRLLIHGPIQGPLGEIGPVTVMTVFGQNDLGDWRVLGRAYSRCDPGALAVELC